MHILPLKQMFAPDRSLRQAIHCVNAQNWGRTKGHKFSQGRTSGGPPRVNTAASEWK
jgi:hypothetical protein